MISRQTDTTVTQRRKPERVPAALKVLNLLMGAETKSQAREAFWGYVFLLPWLIGLVLFIIGPILASLYFSSTEYNILKPPRWVGLANYQKALLKDDLFWPSLGRTLYYAAVAVPIGVIGSLFFALLLNQDIRGKNFFRTLFFLPHLTPTVAMGILWIWILHPQIGPINVFLGALGLPKPGWLADPPWAIPAMLLISLWSGWGGNRMLIFLAGLQGVPEELYEAAKIDGAGTWSRFRHVTLPMISPTMLFNLVLGVIGALKVFSLAYVATKGGPSYATWFVALHIYTQAFDYYRMGYGAALAWLFALMVMAFTFFQLRLSRQWVFYAGA